MDTISVFFFLSFVIEEGNVLSFKLKERNEHSLVFPQEKLKLGVIRIIRQKMHRTPNSKYNKIKFDELNVKSWS